MGVVVKKGDSSGKITGKSARVIDEIVIQTREALSNPYPLREISTDVVKISEIKVIFAGYPSQITPTINQSVDLTTSLMVK